MMIRTWVRERRVLLLALGLTIAGTVGLFWSLDAQEPRSSAQDQDRGLIAFVSPLSEGGMWGWVTMAEPMSAEDSSNITMKFTTAATTVDSISVILAGSLAGSGTHCFADGGEIDLEVGWDELTSEQQEAVTLNMTTRPVTGIVSTFEKDRTVDRESAIDEAEKATYVVIEPGMFNDYELTAAPGGEPKRTYSTKEGSFTCSFPAASLWEESGDERILSFPDVIARRGTWGQSSGEQPYLYVHRKFSVDTVGSDLAYSSVDPVVDGNGSASFLDYWKTWDYTDPSMVSIAQATVVMRPPTSELLRQLTFLGIGFLVATAITLLPLIARSTSVEDDHA